MQRGVKIVIVAVFFVSMLAVSSNLALMQVETIEPESTNLLAELGLRINVIIDQAFYADYDDDGREDDVVTSFRVLIVTDDENRFVIGEDSGYTFILEVETELRLPSGETKTFNFDITTSYGVGITLGWIDHVTESGWYEFTVKADCANIAMNLDQDTISFDPPEEPVDQPNIAIIIKQL